MDFRTHGLRGVTLIALLVWATAALGTEISVGHPAFSSDEGTTTIPIGAYQFCKALPDECRSKGRTEAHIDLTEAAWAELQSINDRFNTTISPVTDRDLYGVDEYWTIPAGQGDCEDYALAKRRALVEAGWPADALLMAVVRRPDGEGHAVLIVRTDRGDLVLDNLIGRIDVWNETPYVFVKRQSQVNARQWVAIALPLLASL